MKYSQAIPKLISNEGFLGLYKGFLALVLRDVPGWGVYFYTYAVFKRFFGINEARKNGTQNSLLNVSIKVCAAGVAGQISWIICYPFDIIKTRI